MELERVNVLVLMCNDTDNILMDKDENALCDMLISGPFPGYVVKYDGELIAVKGMDRLVAEGHWIATLDDLREEGILCI